MKLLLLPRVRAWLLRWSVRVDDVPHPDLAVYSTGRPLFEPVVVTGRVNARRFLQPKPGEKQ
jgi:hypothetical protein